LFVRDIEKYRVPSVSLKPGRKIHRTKVEEYVVNPRSRRLILKGGLTHRRWRKANPGASDLMVVHREPRDVPAVASQTPHPKKATARVCSTSEKAQPRTDPAQTSVASSQSEQLSRRCKRDSTTAQASGDVNPSLLYRYPKDTDEKVSNTIPVSSAEVPGLNTELDVEIWIDEVLQTHGGALLEAYNDPSIDFLEAASKVIGLVDISV